MAAKIPGPEEIVFGTRAVDGWAGFTIHEKHVVTFAPPAVLILKYGHSDSDKMSAARGFQPNVVFLPVKVRLTFNFGIAIAFPVRSPAVVGLGLAELRVKIERFGRESLLIRAIVEIEIEGVYLLLAFVRNGDARMLLKWHGEKRVQGFVAADGEKFGFPAMVFAEAKTKEISQRSFHAWCRFLVPINSQHEPLEVIGFGTRNGNPNVRQQARAVSVQQRERAARIDLTKIRVPSGRIGA